MPYSVQHCEQNVRTSRNPVTAVRSNSIVAGQRRTARDNSAPSLFHLSDLNLHMLNSDVKFPLKFRWVQEVLQEARQGNNTTQLPVGDGFRLVRDRSR